VYLIRFEPFDHRCAPRDVLVLDRIVETFGVGKCDMQHVEPFLTRDRVGVFEKGEHRMSVLVG
jgi:hypothetical protein